MQFIQNPAVHRKKSSSRNPFRQSSFPHEQGYSTENVDRSYWQVSIILAMTPISAPFSNAAATRSLSANCLLTSSPVLCVPSLIRTSMRNRDGRDCSSRTRTPSPMTVARLQWVIVGVMRTVTVWSGESGTFGRVGLMAISGRETTANSPSEIGCSGSEMDEIRSRVVERCPRSQEV